MNKIHLEFIICCDFCTVDIYYSIICNCQMKMILIYHILHFQMENHFSFFISTKLIGHTLMTVVSQILILFFHFIEDRFINVEKLYIVVAVCVCVFVCFFFVWWKSTFIIHSGSLAKDTMINNTCILLRKTITYHTRMHYCFSWCGILHWYFAVLHSTSLIEVQLTRCVCLFANFRTRVKHMIQMFERKKKRL